MYAWSGPVLERVAQLLDSPGNNGTRDFRNVGEVDSMATTYFLTVSDTFSTTGEIIVVTLLGK